MKKIVLTTLLVFLAACSGGASNIGSSSLGGGNSGGSLEGGAVTAVTFDGSNQATLNIGTVSESAEYVLALYSYNDNGLSTSYSMGSSLTADIESDPVGSLSEESEEEDVTEDFHGLLREMESNLNPAAALSHDNSMALKSNLAVSEPELGSTRTFKVLNTLSGGQTYTTVTAVLRYKTSHFYIYMDQRDTASLSDGEIATLAENYDDKIPQERELFGTESDVDDNGHHMVLLTRVVNQLGGSSGGIVTGFFYAVDLFSASSYAISNEAEVFFTFVPDPTGQFGATISKSFALSNILPSVLPHEYQHMISFNMHYFTNGGASESSFLNEGLSHLAEDIYSIDSNDYMVETGIENPARVAGYLNSIEDLCITCGSSLYQRGGSYLLMRYLYEQAEKGNLSGATSGKNLLNRLLNTSNTGVTNIIRAAYGSSVDVTDQFTALMGQFGLAVFLSDTGLSTDNRLEFDGIGLRETQDDNRGTLLDGPSINPVTSFPYSNSVSGASISFIQLTGSDINDQEGQIAVRGSTSTNVGAYLIQTGL